MANEIKIPVYAVAPDSIRIGIESVIQRLRQVPLSAPGFMENSGDDAEIWDYVDQDEATVAARQLREMSDELKQLSERITDKLIERLQNE